MLLVYYFIYFCSYCILGIDIDSGLWYNTGIRREILERRKILQVRYLSYLDIWTVINKKYMTVANHSAYDSWWWRVWNRRRKWTPDQNGRNGWTTIPMLIE